MRTRRAYFDFKFGQLHVRTAFPATGGFDEQVTLVCLHPTQSSSRIFKRFLAEIADVRSVYAPDLPGCGESDPSPTESLANAAGAVSDLANDLRLRQIDLLGIDSGANVAMALAASHPTLVRRLVILGLPAGEGLPNLPQPALVMVPQREAARAHGKLRALLPNVRFADIADDPEKLFDSDPNSLAAQIGAYLSARL